MVPIFSDFQGTYNVSQRNINPLPLWRAVKCSIIPKSTSLWIKTKTTTLQVNTGIYPTQYMAPTNLQQNKQQAKTQQTVQQKKNKKNNTTKLSLITLASPFDRFNKTRANARTIIDYFSPSILSPFPLEITTATRYLQYIMIQ